MFSRCLYEARASIREHYCFLTVVLSPRPVLRQWNTLTSLSSLIIVMPSINSIFFLAKILTIRVRCSIYLFVQKCVCVIKMWPT